MTKTACLILSCDQFADCHPATVACVEKFWPDRSWPLFTTSQSKSWGPHRSSWIKTPDRGWKGDLQYALDKMPGADFVLLFLEDMLLVRQVHSGDIHIAIGRLELEPNVGAILLGQGGEKYESVDESWGCFRRISRDCPYRVSTGPTLWKMPFLMDILEHCGPDAWDFEWEGTKYAAGLPQEIWVMYGADEPKRPFRCHYPAIRRGRWDRNAVDWLNKEFGLQVNTERGFME